MDSLPYTSMILVEPTIMTAEAYALWLAQPGSASAIKRVPAAVNARTDIWESRAAAHKWLRARHPWKRWDARSLATFVVRTPAGMRARAPIDHSHSSTDCAICQQPRIPHGHKASL